MLVVCLVFLVFCIGLSFGVGWLRFVVWGVKFDCSVSEWFLAACLI